ncbi:MAG: F0F1 ATP synthase subunit B [Gammaproteobacteria bacterium]|nr:MAG: F0F1 ATP synthase subunit B [Gammaproteobacteria bacterium]
MYLNLTLVGQAISFAFFVLFCMKYVWPPIMGALHDRREKIAEALAAAEKGAQEREDAEKEVEDMLQHAKAHAAEIVANAQKRSNEIIEASKDTARTEGERIKTGAMAEIEQERVTAREELRKQVGSIAVAGASRILGTEVDEQAHARLIDELVNEI